MVSRFLGVLLAVAISNASAATPAPQKIPAARLDDLKAAAGWALFRRPWISSPSSLVAGGGVGPLYNSRACDSCHMGGGAGRVAEDAVSKGMVVRLGRADATADPVYGVQIQTAALPGFDPEADASVAWGRQDNLRTATAQLSNFHYGALSADTHVGLRRAPSLFGIGEIDSIPEKEILARSGHGHPAWVTGASGDREFARFGWKATGTSLPSQIAIAFQRDFGIGTSNIPGPYGECTAAEKRCREAGGPDVELPDQFRDFIGDYLRTLYPPNALHEDSAGFAIFRENWLCGVPRDFERQKCNAVYAYTDLLLHDLGPGLDDGIAEGAARSSEWRTAPLWDVAGSLARGGLLHDGRPAISRRPLHGMAAKRHRRGKPSTLCRQMIANC